LFDIALVDSFLLARKFIPRWTDADDTESVFWKYVMTLLPQVATEYEGRPTIPQYKCEQVLIGKQKVEKGKSAGRVVAKQMRCTYCIKKNKSRRKSADENTSSDSGTPTRSRRTAYTCISHREAFCCKDGGCWEQHLKECGSVEDMGNNDFELSSDTDSD